MAKKYRTARGQTVDFGAMITKNERVPAIGNMNVNARGDEIRSDGTIVKTRDQLMKEYYKMNTMVPQDGTIPDSGNHAIVDEDPYEDYEPATSTVVEASEPEVAKPSGTLASQVVSETVTSSVATPTTVTQTVKTRTNPADEDGVTRI